MSFIAVVITFINRGKLLKQKYHLLTHLWHPSRVRSLRIFNDPRVLSVACLVMISGCGDRTDEGAAKSADTGQAQQLDPRSGDPSEAQADDAAQAPPAVKDYAKQYQLITEAMFAEPIHPDFDAKAAQVILEEISIKADTKELRANGSIALGHLLESRSDKKAAIRAYQHAVNLVPDDAGPKMALALSLMADKQYGRAAQVQLEASKLDPDNLDNWLNLGQMFLLSGDEPKALEAYTAYELRRRGILDGLTKMRGDRYILDEAGRIDCAHALIPSSDVGTALALIYALQSDPSMKVRVAVVETMGTQRLAGFVSALEKWKAKEPEKPVQESIEWALDEIRKRPISTKDGPVPPMVMDLMSKKPGKKGSDMPKDSPSLAPEPK